jgi:hypothetical protein
MDGVSIFDAGTFGCHAGTALSYVVPLSPDDGVVGVLGALGVDGCGVGLTGSNAGLKDGVEIFEFGILGFHAAKSGV